MTRIVKSSFVAAAICGSMIVNFVNAADWGQFRGPAASGVAKEAVPSKWTDKENVAWKTDLPGRGLSCPIVVGNRVFITASSGFRQDRLHVLCYDAETGKQLWERQSWSTGRTNCHPKMCMATPTPASDGKVVVAFYSTNDVLCYDLEGNLQWLRGLTADYPNASNSVGMSSSAAIHGDVAIVQVENDGHSFAAGLDLKTGSNRWKIERPKGPSWASPFVINDPKTGKDVLVLQSSKAVTGHDPATGKEVWRFDDPTNPIPSCVGSGSLVLVPGRGLTAMQPAEYGVAPKVLWRQPKLAASTPSPVVLNDRVYAISGAGVLTCGDMKDGKVLWQLRLKGPFSSTPIAAGGKLYCFNEDGLGQVVQPEADKGVLVGSSTVGETILCTPAVADGALYVRSDGKLWKIKAKS